MSEHQNNYILPDINYFFKITVSTLKNVVYALAQKQVLISKQNFTLRFLILRLRASLILIEIQPKIKGDGALKKLKL